MLYIVRGLPGSGKSTEAKALLHSLNLKDGKHFEADEFHVLEDEYNWDPNRIRLAHHWCMYNTAMALIQGHDVVVSNTFTRYGEIAPYIKLSLYINDEFPRVGVPKTEWAFDIDELFKRNTHDVPRATIEKMLDRWAELDVHGCPKKWGWIQKNNFAETSWKKYGSLWEDEGKQGKILHKILDIIS